MQETVTVAILLLIAVAMVPLVWHWRDIYKQARHPARRLRLFVLTAYCAVVAGYAAVALMDAFR